MATKSKKVEHPAVKAVAWIIEVAYRGFIGYWVIGHSHNYVVVAAGVYGLVTAALIIAVHSTKAHN